MGPCASDRGDSRRGIDLASRLIWYWITRATAEGVRWLDELLGREAGPAEHPWVYFVRGFLAVLQNDPTAARPALERWGRTKPRAWSMACRKSPLSWERYRSNFP